MIAWLLSRLFPPRLPRMFRDEVDAALRLKAESDGRDPFVDATERERRAWEEDRGRRNPRRFA